MTIPYIFYLLNKIPKVLARLWGKQLKKNVDRDITVLRRVRERSVSSTLFQIIQKNSALHAFLNLSHCPALYGENSQDSLQTLYGVSFIPFSVEFLAVSLCFDALAHEYIWE